MSFTKQTSLDDLLELAKSHNGDGPNEAWGELLLRMVKKQRPLTRRLLGRRAADENNVEDREASALEKIFSDLSTGPNDFDTLENVGAFIGQALRFKGIDENRRSRSLKRGEGKHHVSIHENDQESNYPGAGIDPVDWDMLPQARVLFEEADERFLGRLSDTQKEVLKLHLEQKTIGEIAEHMGCTSRTIDRALHSIRAIAGKEFLDIKPGSER